MTAPGSTREVHHVKSGAEGPPESPVGAGLHARLADRGRDGTRVRDAGADACTAELLWRLADAGPSTQSALSDALQCTPRNVTGLVDALEADDLVRRHAHPTDRRATLVTLTEEGSAIVDGWNRGYDELAHRMFDDVPDDDLHGFELTLDHVLDRLRDDQPPTDESTRVRSRPTRGTPTSGAGGG